MTSNPYQPNGYNNEQQWSYQDQPSATQPTTDPYASTGAQSWDPYPTTAHPTDQAASYADPYAQAGGYVPVTQDAAYGYQSSGYAAQGTLAPVMTVKDWIITSLLMAIPVANIVLLFMWAFSTTENPNRTNWAKAGLILAGIVLAVYVVFFIFIFAIIGAASR